ncbi:MAG: hypothetical protein CMI81_04370 [Candidatus Pelagibacter sp.]|nr:hypothetical protein [Candidatus Pelagibacter sp.]
MIAIICIVALPLLILPRKNFLSKLVYFLGWYFLRVTKLIYNINVEMSGFDNLKKYENFIIASAHQSMFETFVFNYLVPDAFFVIKKELLFIPFYNLYLMKLGYVPIERKKITKKNLNFYKKISYCISNTTSNHRGNRCNGSNYCPLKTLCHCHRYYHYIWRYRKKNALYNTYKR